MARVYVATAFCNREQALLAMTALRAEGHSITHDWTSESAAHLPPGPEQREFLELCGVADFFGVLEADVLLLLAHPEMRDARAEMGIALGRDITVVVVEHPDAHSVFFGFTKRVEALEDALVLLRGL